MPQIYLIRHGIAADRDLYEHDHDRPLTPKGIEKTQRIAQHFALLGLRFDRLLTSPLVRAQQTAEIFREYQLAPTLEIFPALAPDGEATTWLAWWNQQAQPSASSPVAPLAERLAERLTKLPAKLPAELPAQSTDLPENQTPPQTGALRTIALVGHQPDLGHWAEILVWGEAYGKLVVKKAGIIGVELPAPTLEPVQPGAGELFWLAPPRLLLP